MKFERIKKLRQENKLTQQQIADILKISQQRYSDYENGKYDIPNIVLLKIANYYHVVVLLLFIYISIK